MKYRTFFVVSKMLSFRLKKQDKKYMGHLTFK